MMEPRQRLGGIEAGGTKIVCSLGAENGELEESESFKTESPEVTIPKIIQWYESRVLPEAFGVGTFGPVNLNEGADYGRIEKTPKPGWEGFSWTEALHQAFRKPVAVATDVEAAGLAEWKYGVGRGQRLIVYYTIGTGIGAGILLNGEFLRGRAHSEMGHVTVPVSAVEADYAGVCPFHCDCLEGRASGTAIKDRWGKPGPDLGENHEAWDLEAEYVSAALQSLVASLSPDRIIFGGGVSQQAGLLEKVRSRLLERCNGYFSSLQTPDDAEALIQGAGLGQQAGMVGSLCLAAQAAGAIQ